MKHPAAVCCIHPYKTDPNYLLASSFDGSVNDAAPFHPNKSLKILKWDLRLGKVVTRFEGNKNNCLMLSFCLDTQEEFLIAGIYISHSPL